MMHPNHPLAVWLTSSGIDPAMGGIASVTRSCLEALAPGEFPEAGPAPGGAMRFICLQNPPDREAEDCAGKLRNRFCRGSRLRFVLENAWQILAKPDWVIHEHVDLAQCQTLLPRFLQSRYAVWCHGIELWRELPPRKQKALKGADLLLFNSAFTREKAATFHPWILDCAFQVVPLCREPNTGKAASPGSTPATISREPAILTVGRLIEDRPKGHLEILNALPSLTKEIPNLHWHIVGDGPWRESLENAILEAGVANQATVHGFVSAEKLDHLYRSSRIFAMPSHGEGFGLVYAEAMAQGLPCIGSTLDAAPEVIREGGMCVDLSNLEALPQALAQYLGMEEEEFEHASSQARQRSEFFRLERFAYDLQEALRKDG